MQLSKNDPELPGSWMQTLNRFVSVNCFVMQVVGVTGFEPVTLRLSSACSNQLSYTPIFGAEQLVELRRLELLTYSLQSYRSTN